MAEKFRAYNTKPQDVLADLSDNQVTKLIKRFSPASFVLPQKISEKDITHFCSGCDNFQGEGIVCRVVGANDQARYAARKNCGWASVDGQRVIKEG